MKPEKIKETLANLMSQLTPDVHEMDGLGGWEQVGCIISFKELGQFGFRVSANPEGAFLFETIFGLLPLTRDNLLSLNQYNLSSIFRGAVDEDGYLNIDYSYFGIKTVEELEEVFAHLMNTFSDAEHLQILQNLVRKTTFQD